MGIQSVVLVIDLFDNFVSIMTSIFNFQSGEFNNSTPGWFEWISLFFIVLGSAVAFFIYYKQRCDNAEDAYKLFQNSLSILNIAVEDTIIQLTKFKSGLLTSNDDFIKPNLSANLNDRFLSRIDLTSLTRYYKGKTAKEYTDYKIFIEKSSFIGIYHDYFLNEMNYFRSEFRAHEKTFQQHRLLAANILNDIVDHRLAERDVFFAAQYASLVKRVVDNANIVRDGQVINRDLLNEEFVKELVLLTSQFIGKDAKANEVNGIANEVYSARYDMNSLKTQMSDTLTKNINEFRKIKDVIISLLNTPTMAQEYRVRYGRRPCAIAGL